MFNLLYVSFIMDNRQREWLQWWGNCKYHCWEVIILALMTQRTLQEYCSTCLLMEHSSRLLQGGILCLLEMLTSFSRTVLDNALLNGLCNFISVMKKGSGFNTWPLHALCSHDFALVSSWISPNLGGLFNFGFLLNSNRVTWIVMYNCKSKSCVRSFIFKTNKW